MPFRLSASGRNKLHYYYHEAPYDALQKLYQKLSQRLCNTSAHPVYWLYSKMEYAVRRGVQGGLPLEALLEALLKALYGAPKLY